MSERDREPRAVGDEVNGRRRNESVEEGPALSEVERAGENVPREARSEEGIPPSPQGDGAGDDVAREGVPHRVNPAVGDVGG
jgi:hypothetical protein